MRRPLISTSLASLGLMLVTAHAATAASLTRIETRPVYGAIITEEEGVRVYRPLPPTRHMIINPDGQTPLNLTIEDRNVVVQHHHYGAPSGETSEGAGRFGGGYGAFLPHVQHGSRGHRHARRSRPSGHMISVPRAVRGGR